MLRLITDVVIYSKKMTKIYILIFVFVFVCVFSVIFIRRINKEFNRNRKNINRFHEQFERGKKYVKVVVENSTTPNIEHVKLLTDLSEHMLSLGDSDELTNSKYNMREEILNLYLVKNRKYLK